MLNWSIHDLGISLRLSSLLSRRKIFPCGHGTNTFAASFIAQDSSEREKHGHVSVLKVVNPVFYCSRAPNDESTCMIRKHSFLMLAGGVACVGGNKFLRASMAGKQKKVKRFMGQHYHVFLSWIPFWASASWKSLEFHSPLATRAGKENNRIVLCYWDDIYFYCVRSIAMPRHEERLYKKYNKK